MAKLNIYIVEDSPIIAAALKQLIIKLGHTVAGVSESYEDAVEHLSKAAIDMVITDIMLSGKKNGIDLGAYVKEHLNVPVIYQSSITDTGIVYDAMRTGPLAYLVKPVGRQELSTALLSVEAV
ncbi:response regulator [Mucilaginibacter sp. UR6-11]|uniref:response regulator n=1 Tax=Mucilaginibacter sp. UR6-11 TaxID=1435644 RepID=UPI001E5FABA2|nr:response regulator [Mucilaginibacter sp. UR6-11]MCC8424647.1 response regulator [Mucilaginibacter sp. UR6-11]